MEKSSNLLTFNAPVFKIDAKSRILKKSSADEKKNLSKHHLILPNNTQICVETLLQCVSEDQTDRKCDTKLRARLKKKKVSLFRPQNFILKNERLRPIVTTNIRSGVFRSVEFRASQKQKNCVNVPSNVLYSQSSLSSRIQSIKDFCNDKWIVERTTQYMPNDWTRPVASNGNASQDRDILDAGGVVEIMKPKDFWLGRNEVKLVRSRNE